MTLRVTTLAAAAALLVLLPVTVSHFHSYQLALVGIYFIAIIGLNVLTGYSGQISLGHGAFMAIGAYTTAILSVNYGVSEYWTIPCAGVITGLFGFAFGFPARRLSGVYLALATLGLSIIFPKVVEKYNFTGGSNGKRLGRKRLVPPAWTHLDRQSDRPIWIYFVILSFTVVLFVLARNLFRSRPGQPPKRRARDAQVGPSPRYHVPSNSPLCRGPQRHCARQARSSRQPKPRSRS